MDCCMTFQYMYIVCNDQIQVIGISIRHLSFLCDGNIKSPSISYCEIFSSLLSIIIILLAIEDEKSFLFPNCILKPRNDPFCIPNASPMPFLGCILNSSGHSLQHITQWKDCTLLLYSIAQGIITRNICTCSVNTQYFFTAC